MKATIRSRPRRAVYRRRLSASVVSRRFREMWAEAFGFGSFANQSHIRFVRMAMRDLAVDDKYWKAISEMVEQQAKLRAMKDKLKAA